MAESLAPVRIDKWLWAARITKTRTLATDAVKGGRVNVNGERIKPSRDVKPGDEIEIAFGQGRRITVVVKGTAEKRGSATVAQGLYDETAESRAEREQMAAERRAAPTPVQGEGRPSKRDRRRLDAMRKGSGR